jgi:nitrogenase molybdenum-iron protein alpha/beta subunit
MDLNETIEKMKRKIDQDIEKSRKQLEEKKKELIGGEKHGK